MNTRNTNTHLTIVSLIFLNLPILLAIITLEDQESFPSSSQNIVVQNETEYVTSDSVLENNGDLEPSIELDLESTDNTTENSNISTRILPNDTPVLLPTDSSTIEVELAEVSLVLTSQHEEMPAQNIVAQTENIPNNISSNISQTDAKKLTETLPMETESEEKNITEGISEDIPSFSEWAQKRLEEVEKNEQSNNSVKVQVVNGKGTNAKLRWKNYASLDCGAKVVGANTEAVSPGSILSPAVDEYKLNPCTSRIWFVVELCEAIQAQRIDLANYELFSSSPKDFTVSVSERYPTRDWAVLGKFTAKDERDIQSFDIDTQLFGKYIKVEIKSHYGTEHYCPISLFRAYGMSVFEGCDFFSLANQIKVEKPDCIFSLSANLASDKTDKSVLATSVHIVRKPPKAQLSTKNQAIQISPLLSQTSTVLQKEDSGNAVPNDEDDDDDDEEETLHADHYPGGKPQKNLFSSATDAVISMVKRAAEALGNKVDNETVLEKKSNASALVNICSSPRHVVVCNNCSESLYEQIFELLSCKAEEIRKLVGIPEFLSALVESEACRKFGYDFKTPSKKNISSEHVEAFFPEKYLGAMCNEAAILEGYGLLNVSQQFKNVTKNLTKDKINMDVKEVDQPELRHNETFSGDIDVITNVSDTPSTASAEDVSQIKPTKTSSAEPDLTQTDVPEQAPAPENITESLESTTASHEVTIDTPLNVEVEVTTEGSEVLEEHMDNIISDINIDSQSTTVPSSTTSNSPQAPKESIFLRLSNRIKALERNMSLSGQYLEELSKRYKKQVEEMQFLLEKTIATLREETQERTERNKHLEDRLNNLTTSMEQLMAERRFFLSTVYYLLFFAVVSMGFYIFCGARSKVRRKSLEMDEVFHPLTEEYAKVRKKRRPSDQVLKIVRYSSVNEDEKYRRARKRKKKSNKRSNSVGSLKIKDEDWVENTHQVIEDVPYLDESDNLTLEACNLPNDFYKSDSPRTLDNGEDSSLQTTECSLTYPNIISNEPVKKEKKGFKKFLKKVF